MAKPRSAAPTIAVIMLLLPVLYVGSYLALVRPEGFISRDDPFGDRVFYRWGGSYSAKFFWPLEWIDCKVRPRKWEPGADPQRTYW